MITIYYNQYCMLHAAKESTTTMSLKHLESTTYAHTQMMFRSCTRCIYLQLSLGKLLLSFLCSQWTAYLRQGWKNRFDTMSKTDSKIESYNYSWMLQLPDSSCLQVDSVSFSVSDNFCIVSSIFFSSASSTLGNCS